MLPRSISPKVVPFLTIPLALLLYIPLEPVEDALFRALHIPGKHHPPVVLLAIFIFLVAVVVPRLLGQIGIHVRSRSVERLESADRDDESIGPIELPIRIVRGKRLMKVLSAVFSIAGLACLMLAWFLPSAAWETPWMKTVAMLSLATFLLILGFLFGRAEPVFVCEITRKGILAPDGFWGRHTFVRWDDLVRCEIIRDDTRWPDHFVAWDRKGRRRFRRSKYWLGQVKRSDRTRIFRALRARFPQKEKRDDTAVPKLVAASAVWDRELDG